MSKAEDLSPAIPSAAGAVGLGTSRALTVSGNGKHHSKDSLVLLVTSRPWLFIYV